LIWAKNENRSVLTGRFFYQSNHSAFGLKKMIRRNFRRSECGATAVEYSLIAAFIALVIIGALLILGQAINAPLDEVGQTLTTINRSAKP